MRSGPGAAAPGALRAGTAGSARSPRARAARPRSCPIGGGIRPTVPRAARTASRGPTASTGARWDRRRASRSSPATRSRSPPPAGAVTGRMSLDGSCPTVSDRSEPLMAEERARMLRRFTVAVSMLVTGVLVAGAPAAPAASCLNTMPVSQVTTGMTTHGLTVSHGKVPEPFTATVLGVLKDGVAPGVDMIIVEADSAALDKAGGIWAGMSGSPVYADSDNRLLGAVAYGLSFGPSKIGGLAAAEDMDKVLQLTSPPAAPRTVALSKALKAKIVSGGDATARELSGGLQQLPLPLSVSGLRGSRLGAFAGRLSGAERYVPFSAGTVASDPADIADIVPGGNFAAAMSYGDIAA